MARYFIDISFDGSNYAGWQRQNNALSIQQVFEEKISLKLKVPIELVGCGRTDAGVHARQFMAHFDTDIEFDTQSFLYAMNRFLPEQLAINNIYRVKDDAHARFSAIERMYKYYILRRKNPFLRNFSYEYIAPLNVELMNLAAEMLINADDFTSFTKLHGGSKHARCKLSECRWEFDNDMLVFIIAANRFTRNMVRSIVGTLLEVGKEKITIEQFYGIINGRNRMLAGESVEAKGLFLEKVVYPEDIFIDAVR
ncbi:MAG: tRNA pseudouridine(38-40) synthase TruA [Bacteroidales bacterium]|nr:tRNA pseudouridine(38-40) synthase TruA [Bacteroidales bacterium]